MTWKNIAKDHFWAGLLTLTPLFVLVIVFQWLFGGLVHWIDEVPLNWILKDQASPLRLLFQYLLLFASLIAGFISISVFGFFSKFYFGKKMIEAMGEVIVRIPVFGTIYVSLNKLLKTLSNSEAKQFSRVVFVEFPRKDVWVVAFVTGPVTMHGIPDGYLNVFVANSPTPFSGYHVMVKESEVVDSGLSVDDAFKILLSLGMAQPSAKLGKI